MSSEIIPLPTREEVLENIRTPAEEYQQYLSRLSKDKFRKVQATIGSISNGLYAVAPLTCLGPQKCPFIEKCPIPDREKDGTLIEGPLDEYPIGQGCVLEEFFMRQKVHDYIEYLNINPTNPVEMAIANELAVIDLYKNRATMIMSVGDKNSNGRDFLITDVIAVTESGSPIESIKEHPVVGILDKLEKRRLKYLEQLNETRKAQSEIAIKLGNREVESRVLQEISTLRQALLQAPTVTLELDEEILIK